MQEKYAEKEKIKYNHSYIHNLIEHNIDVIILKEAKSLRPAEINIDTFLCPDKNVVKRQAELLNAALQKILPNLHVKTEKIEQAFYDMHRNTKTMIDHGVKKRLVLKLEKILHTGPALSSLIEGEESDGMMDYMNLSKESWKNPFDKAGGSYNDNFYEVFDLSLIHIFCEMGPLVRIEPQGWLYTNCLLYTSLRLLRAQAPTRMLRSTNAYLSLWTLLTSLSRHLTVRLISLSLCLLRTYSPLPDAALLLLVGLSAASLRTARKLR